MCLTYLCVGLRSNEQSWMNKTIGRLKNWLTNIMTDSQIDRLTKWLIRPLNDLQNDWLIDGLGYTLVDLKMDWLIDWLIDRWFKFLNWKRLNAILITSVSCHNCQAHVLRKLGVLGISLQLFAIITDKLRHEWHITSAREGGKVCQEPVDRCMWVPLSTAPFPPIMMLAAFV